jgi:cellulose synthase/poly-beta-1,6-N-acetylglucosamine synthase-like glycosyltransferase
MTEFLAWLESFVAASLYWVSIPVFVYFLVINTSYLLLILGAAAEFREHMRRLPFAGRDETLGSQFAPGVSVIVPMYNEEVGIVTSVQSLLSLHYPRHEVVVVDDGSTDNGFEVLRKAFDLVEIDREISLDVPVREGPVSVHVPADGWTRLTVVRSKNSGRSDSLNLGVNASVEDLVVFIDADSILDPDALLAVAKPFADDPVRAMAVGGVIRAVNGCRVEAGRVVDVRLAPRLLPRIQVVEYLRAFHLGRAGWSRAGALILISGAFGVFRRDIITQVGGLDPDSIGEDFELVLRLHRTLRRERRPYRIGFVTEPICWTEVPSTLPVLRRQRARWHRGLWETLWKYRGMFANPRYGIVGLIAVPYYWFFELIAPLIELFGLALMVLGFAMGLVNVPFFWLFISVAYIYAVLVTMAAMLIEELSFHKYPHWPDMFRTLGASIVENFGYRQLTAIWRLEGWWASLRGRKQVWGTMTREGFADSEVEVRDDV